MEKYMNIYKYLNLFTLVALGCSLSLFAMEPEKGEGKGESEHSEKRIIKMRQKNNDKVVPLRDLAAIALLHDIKDDQNGINSFENLKGYPLAHEYSVADFVGEFVEPSDDDYESLLHSANSVVEVKNLLKFNPNLDINGQNQDKKTVFKALIDRGNLKGAHYLLKTYRGQLDVSTPDGFGETPLQKAIKRKDIDLASAITELLRKQSKGNRINTANKIYEETLLFAAQYMPEIIHQFIGQGNITERSSKQAIQLLLEKGNAKEALYLYAFIVKDEDKAIELLDTHKIDINTPPYKGRRLIFDVIDAELNKIIKKLIALGVDVNAENSNGITALLHAIRYKRLKAIPILCQHRANVNAQDKNGWTTLMYAVRYAPDALPVLLAHEADVNAQNIDGLTVLVFAIELDLDAVPVLIQAGAKINNRDQHGQTALMIAARFTPEVLLILLERGAEVNARDNKGYTALMVASRYNVRSIPILLGAGADITLEADDGSTVLTFANKYKPRIVPYLTVVNNGHMEQRKL